MKLFRMLPIYFFLICTLWSSANSFAVQASPAPEVSARLLLDHQTVVPGQTFQAVVFLTHLNDWHTYWLNPGDSGLPTTIEWKLPSGFKAGDARWTYPKRFFSDGIANYGYSGIATAFTTVQAPLGLGEGVNVKIAAKVSWLACREVCVPQSQTIEARVVVGKSSVAADEPVLQLMQKMSEKLPKNDPSIQISAAVDANYYWLNIVNTSNRIIPLTDMYFFDFNRERMNHSEVQVVLPNSAGVYLKIPKFKKNDSVSQPLSGVLAVNFKRENQDIVYAIEVNTEIENAQNWPDLKRYQKQSVFTSGVLWVVLVGLFFGFAGVWWVQIRGRSKS